MERSSTEPLVFTQKQLQGEPDLVRSCLPSIEALISEERDFISNPFPMWRRRVITQGD